MCSTKNHAGAELAELQNAIQKQKVKLFSLPILLFLLFMQTKILMFKTYLFLKVWKKLNTCQDFMVTEATLLLRHLPHLPELQLVTAVELMADSLFLSQ